MRELLKDPLVHFLGAGLALFALASLVKPAEADEKTIAVDRTALLEFIQYRSKAFEPATAAKILDSMNTAERKVLIDDFVREEALAREAQSMGLEANDYVIKQRMVRKAEFLVEATAAPSEPSEDAIRNFYEANHSRYALPASATLTHVFISTEHRDRNAARAQARSILETLRASNAGFNDATGYGERFIFHKNYVERTDDYITSQLGPEIGEAVFGAGAPLGEWTGPYPSQYGEHLVFIASRQAARAPALDEIRDIVSADLKEELRAAAIGAAIDEIVAGYKVENRFSGGR
ncbi:MAG: peptidylprolyl isomerase [Parvularculaceae bacterium]|nr:peptidyl-prolyl cis-trans isomerase [Parvularculaceae bacterium]